MHLSVDQGQALARVFAALAEDHAEGEIRQHVGEALLRLLGADQFASFVWDDATARFGQPITINMDGANLDSYEQYFQFHDPITPQLQARRGPTLVNQVMPQRELMRTEFYNDFLSRDGLHFGVNLYACDGDSHIGDLRVWRARHRRDFDQDTLALLALIEPAFTQALKRARRQRLSRLPSMPVPILTSMPVPILTSMPTSRSTSKPAPVAAATLGLSPKEEAVARSVSDGLTDKEIARDLGIAFTTVRTHLARIYRKLGLSRRSQLVRLLYDAADGTTAPRVCPDLIPEDTGRTEVRSR